MTYALHVHILLLLHIVANYVANNFYNLVAGSIGILLSVSLAKGIAMYVYIESVNCYFYATSKMIA